jgi:5-(carboxyamino)imidazole ribonucleotide synthase
MAIMKSIPGLSLGILGAGQLGRMMAQDARNMGIKTVCLDPHSDPPAKGICDEFIQGNLHDPEAIDKLAARSDIITFEIEHVNADYLEQEIETHKPVYPRPGMLKIIQNKLHQKEFYKKHKIPTPNFQAVSAQDLKSYRPKSFPFIQKTQTGGYDGKGVAVIRSEKELETMLPVDSIMEEFIDFEREIAILVARNVDGEIATYPVIDMDFHQSNQICRRTVVPSVISRNLQDQAFALGKEVIEAFDCVGLLAIECFITKSGQILVNEVAPRPHNSGHWTIEGSITSQFAQHIRAVCNLALGSTELIAPNVMVNLLGAEDAHGIPAIQGYEEFMRESRSYLHWYQKPEVKPFRKVGHFTVLAESREQAIANSEKIEEYLCINSKK